MCCFIPPLSYQFMQALSSPVVVVSHTAAQILGAFGAADVPNGEWATLVPTLLENVINAAVPDQTKVASLEVIFRCILSFLFIIHLFAFFPPLSISMYVFLFLCFFVLFYYSLLHENT